jgi:hypothetical protein
MRIFNVSEINYEFGDYENFDVELHAKKISNSSNLDFYFHKNNHNSFFIIVKETDVESPKTQITAYELLIPSKKTSDFLSTIRGPL